jgi:acetyl-CoA acetyltransferase
MKKHYGIDSMAETAENVAEQFSVNRQDQDWFALRSHQRWTAAENAGFFEKQVVPVTIPQKKGEPKVFSRDEHPRPDIGVESIRYTDPLRENSTIDYVMSPVRAVVDELVVISQIIRGTVRGCLCPRP